MRRPADLAEVAQFAREHPEEFGRRLGEFADTFYLSESDAERQACLDPEPELVGDPLIDAWIGAAGEHLAQRWRLRIPAWTRRPAHFRLEQPSFHPANPAVAAILFVESPPAFRRRHLFVSVEPLSRARLPKEKRARLALPYPEPPSPRPIPPARPDPVRG